MLLYAEAGENSVDGWMNGWSYLGALRMGCRATQMDRSWWRVLTKYGPLEKGMANHFSILALRTPRFNPWVEKIPWRREWPGEFHG